jgi:hypothetical protein
VPQESPAARIRGAGVTGLTPSGTTGRFHCGIKALWAEFAKQVEDFR